MLLGISEAARRLRKNEATVRRLTDKGLIPCQLDSEGRRLFNSEDIDRIAAEKSRKPRGVTP